VFQHRLPSELSVIGSRRSVLLDSMKIAVDIVNLSARDQQVSAQTLFNRVEHATNLWDYDDALPISAAHAACAKFAPESFGLPKPIY
jgi:hypothetical protein